MHRVQNALVSNKGREGKRRVVGEERRGGGEVGEEGVNRRKRRRGGRVGRRGERKRRRGGDRKEGRSSRGEGLMDISVGPITRNALSRAEVDLVYWCRNCRLPGWKYLLKSNQLNKALGIG